VCVCVCWCCCGCCRCCVGVLLSVLLHSNELLFNLQSNHKLHNSRFKHSTNHRTSEQKRPFRHSMNSTGTRSITLLFLSFSAPSPPLTLSPAPHQALPPSSSTSTIVTFSSCSSTDICMSNCLHFLFVCPSVLSSDVPAFI